MSDHFAAIGAVSGLVFPFHPNRALRPVPVISFHGTTVRATLSTIVVCTATHMQGDPYMHTHHITPSWEYVNSVRHAVHITCQSQCVALRSPSNASPSRNK